MSITGTELVSVIGVVNGVPGAEAFITTTQQIANLGGGGGGGVSRNISSISTSQTAGSTANTDYVYFCTGTITITLPTAVGNTNRYSIKNYGTGVITINTTSSQTIDTNSTSVTLSTQNASNDFISNGSNWGIVA